MAEIWTMGEMIVEIMREKENEPLDKAGVFRGRLSERSTGDFY